MWPWEGRAPGVKSCLLRHRAEGRGERSRQITGHKWYQWFGPLRTLFAPLQASGLFLRTPYQLIRLAI